MEISKLFETTDWYAVVTFDLQHGKYADVEKKLSDYLLLNKLRYPRNTFTGKVPLDSEDPLDAKEELLEKVTQFIKESGDDGPVFVAVSRNEIFFYSMP